MKDQKLISISLYEFYAICLANLRDKAPWEKSPKITKYHQSFLAEERLLAMSILYIIGDDYIPSEVIKTMPLKYREQVSDSVNKAVFTRSLKNYFRNEKDPSYLANETLSKMTSYIQIIKKAQHNNEDPTESATFTLAKRIPPQNKKQLENYEQSIEQIITFLDKEIDEKLMKKYKITEL